MRLGYFFSLLASITLLASGAVNACVYYAGRCGPFTEVSASLRPVLHYSSSTSGFPGSALPLDAISADVRSDCVFLGHGHPQGLGGFGFWEEQGGPDRISSFSDQLLTALFNPALSAAKCTGAGHLKLVVDSPSRVELADLVLGFLRSGDEGGEALIFARRHYQRAGLLGSVCSAFLLPIAKSKQPNLREPRRRLALRWNTAGKHDDENRPRAVRRSHKSRHGCCGFVARNRIV